MYEKNSGRALGVAGNQSIFCGITDQLDRRKFLKDYQYFLIILNCSRKWREF
jgi:hypothetical protein